jgi:alpha-L-fucosidase
VVAVSLSLDRLQWFKNAKFGMFIHWGPYSRLAGEWNGNQVPVGENAEWIMQKLRIPRQTYRNLARQFNPKKFNAKDWVELAKSTGMKYLVITAKHHDGFAMYKSRVSEYNIVNWTKFNRDPLKELKQECERAGIKFCIYYSHREDWDETYAYGNDWDFDFNPEKNLDLFEKNYLETKSKPQIKELIKNYGPFGLIWFDRGLYTPEQARDFIQICRQLQPDIIINGRVGSYEQELLGDYQNMSDNGMPIGGIEEYWETPQTLNETWGFSRFDTLWKSPQEVIRRLAEVVSAGGNYLLNVGPTGEGIIPKPSVDILNQVGVWMEKNKNAIYGTMANPFPKLSWGTCTIKDSRLYLILLYPPESGKIILPGLNNRIVTAFPLGQMDNKLIAKNNTLILPKTIQENDVIIVDLDGSPDIDPPVILPQKNGHIQFDYITARTFGKTKKRYNRKGKFHISKWQSPQDYVSWNFKLSKPGTYKVLMTYTSQPYSVGKKVHLQSGKNNLDFKFNSTGEWYDFKTESCGEMTFAPGEHTLSIRPGQRDKEDLFYFKSVELVPLQR